MINEWLVWTSESSIYAVRRRLKSWSIRRDARRRQTLEAFLSEGGERAAYVGDDARVGSFVAFLIVRALLQQDDPELVLSDIGLGGKVLRTSGPAREKEPEDLVALFESWT